MGKKENLAVLLEIESPLPSLPSEGMPYPTVPKNELLPWKRLSGKQLLIVPVVIQLWARTGTDVSLRQKMSALPYVMH